MRQPIRSPIRTVLVLAVAAGGLLAGGAARSADVATTTGPIRVVFADPERFTDLRDRPLGGVAADDPALAELSRFVQSQAAPKVAAGQTLEVRITDVDRAGHFEPRRGPGLDAVRVVRDVTPPRIALAFRLLGADGQVVKSGTRELTDINFLSRPRESPADPLRHEKRLLAQWIERDLR